MSLKIFEAHYAIIIHTINITSRQSFLKMERNVDETNNSLTVNEYLDGTKAENSKKLEAQVVKLFNSTMMTLLKKQNEDGQSTSNMEFKKLELYDLESLPQALCRFFMVVQRNDGKMFNASSLSSYYRALARFLKNREQDPIDITQDIRFSKVASVVKSRCTEAAKEGSRPGVNASKCLSDEDIKTVFNSGSLTRENLDLLKM